MNIKMKWFFLIMTLVGAVAVSVVAVAQEHTPSATAKAEFDKARPLGGSDWKAAAALYRKAIDLDPDFYEAHQYYILSSQTAAGQLGTEEERKVGSEKAWKELQHLYLRWSKEHPEKAVYQWALGTLYEYKNPDLAVHYYQQVVKLDVKYAPAYDMLAASAEEHGDLELSREYARKAVEAWPNDETVWRHYADSWHDADLKKATEICLQGSEKFPDAAADMLGYLAWSAKTEKDSRELYELLRQKFLKQSADRLRPLFIMDLNSDLGKALDLAQEMVKNNPDNKDWPPLLNYAQAIVDAEALIGQVKASDALAALDKVTLPRYTDRRPLELIRAKALDAVGQTEKAYGDLLTVFAKTPSDPMRTALLGYGKKLGKDAKQVDADVWTKRQASAKPGVPFSLVSFTTGKPVSLEDYKGKVFLVNFWYPKCGPCRGEFPFFQAILDKYKSQGFEILAINGQPAQDDWVMPLIKGRKLGFLPLKGNEEIVKAFKVRGYPTNFLFGPDGRIYYQPPPVTTISARRELELQIEGLLEQAKPALPQDK